MPDQLWQDLRYALRNLRHAPGFTSAAVLLLALGIGASTTVFSIVDTVSLRPLPYPDSGQLIWTAIRFGYLKTDFIPSPDYVAWRRDNTVFQQLAAMRFSGTETLVMSGPEAADVHSLRVSANFLATLGVGPMIGRSFVAQEELPNGPRAVILSFPFWRDHFHSNREIVGQNIILAGVPHAVVGVLPQSFLFPVDAPVDALTTLPVSPTATHHDREMATWRVFGRLITGITLRQARANLATLYAASQADEPRFFKDSPLIVETLQEHRAGDSRLLLLVLSGAVLCLLLIACANVASLLLARWSARSRELAVRSAIGAGRARLICQLLVEAGLLAAIGCALGTGLTAITLRGFARLAGEVLPRLAELHVDLRVFTIALTVSLLTTLVFGAFPAFRAGRTDIQSVLQQAGRGANVGGHQGLRRALVAAEIALSIILLCGAALLLQTLWHLENSGLGFAPEHATTVTIPLRGTRWENRREELAAELLTSLRRIPGTQAAAFTQCVPLLGSFALVNFSRSDRPLPEPFHHGDNIGVCGVGPDYFRAVGSRIIRGRDFTDADFDHPGTLALINEAAVRAYFPGEDPIGKQIGHDTEDRWKTVVGIVEDFKNQGLGQPAMPQMYVNALGLGDAEAHVAQLVLIVRSAADEKAFESEIRTAFRSIDPEIFARFETLDATISRIASGPRFNSVLVASFAGLAFLMATFGVYGVFAFTVTQRTPEIGVRMALGADPNRVLLLVLREGIAVAGIGIMAGLGGALALTRYLKALLYGVSPTDLTTYVAVAAGLAAAAMFATFLPARRAASVEPMQALRHE